MLGWAQETAPYARLSHPFPAYSQTHCSEAPAPAAPYLCHHGRKKENREAGAKREQRPEPSPGLSRLHLPQALLGLPSWARGEKQRQRIWHSAVLEKPLLSPAGGGKEKKAPPPTLDEPPAALDLGSKHSSSFGSGHSSLPSVGLEWAVRGEGNPTSAASVPHCCCRWPSLSSHQWDSWTFSTARPRCIL